MLRCAEPGTMKTSLGRILKTGWIASGLGRRLTLRSRLVIALPPFVTWPILHANCGEPFIGILSVKPSSAMTKQTGCLIGLAGEDSNFLYSYVQAPRIHSHSHPSPESIVD